MSDGEDDPFERLGDVERDGDPFERLDDADEPGETVTADDEAATADDPTTGPRTDPFADLDRDASGGERAAPGDEPTASDGPTVDDAGPGDPFAGMDQPTSDPFGEAGSVFEQADIGSVDEDEVWASITDDEDEDAEDESVVIDDDRHAEVSKHAFCEQCEHFSEPPDSHCTHESAEIIEYLDMERVRLRDCPVVAERQNLE